MAALNIIIEKLTAKKLEGRCTDWESFPKPGYFIAFLTQSDQSFYAQIDAVMPIAGDPDSLFLTLIPVSGTPDTRIKQARQLTQYEFFQLNTVASDIAIPLNYHNNMLDLAKSGSVVFIKPSEEAVHLNLLQSFHQAQVPTLVIDPVGIDLSSVPHQAKVLGENVQLSLQEIGVNHFIEWVVEDLPTTIQAQAAEFMLSLVPPTPDFIPIQYFVGHPLLKDHPLSAAILHRLYEFHKNRLFASLPQKALGLNQVEGCMHFNFSHLPPDLLPLAYEGILRMVLRHILSPDIQVFMVAPEVRAPFCREYIHQAPNRVFLISNLAKPWRDVIVDRWEETRFFGEDGVEISGKITGGIKFFIPYHTASAGVEALPSATKTPLEERALSASDAIPPVMSETAQSAWESSADTPDFDEATTHTSPLPSFNLEENDQPANTDWDNVPSTPTDLSQEEPTPLLAIDSLVDTLVPPEPEQAEDSDFSVPSFEEIPTFSLELEANQAVSPLEPEETDFIQRPLPVSEEPATDDPYPILDLTLDEVDFHLTEVETDEFTALSTDPSDSAPQPTDSYLSSLPAEDDSLPPTGVLDWEETVSEENNTLDDPFDPAYGTQDTLAKKNNTIDDPFDPAYGLQVDPGADFTEDAIQQLHAHGRADAPRPLEQLNSLKSQLEGEPAADAGDNDWALEAILSASEASGESKPASNLTEDALPLDDSIADDAEPSDTFNLEALAALSASYVDRIEDPSPDEPDSLSQDHEETPAVSAEVSTDDIPLSWEESDPDALMNRRLAEDRRALEERRSVEDRRNNADWEPEDHVSASGESSDELWNIDLDTLSGITSDDSGFFLLLRKEIPNITQGIPPIPFIPIEGDLSFEGELGALTPEENLFSTMAPDLMESVQVHGLEANPEDLKLDAAYVSSSSTVVNRIYIDAPISDSAEAQDFVESLVITDEHMGMSGYTQVPADHETAQVAGYGFEHHTTGPSEEASKPDEQSLSQLLDALTATPVSEMSADFSPTPPILSLDEGVLVDPSPPPGDVDAETLARASKEAKPSLLGDAWEHTDAPGESDSDLGFHLKLDVDDTDTGASEEHLGINFLELDADPFGDTIPPQALPAEEKLTLALHEEDAFAAPDEPLQAAAMDFAFELPPEAPAPPPQTEAGDLVDDQAMILDDLLKQASSIVEDFSEPSPSATPKLIAVEPTAGDPLDLIYGSDAHSQAELDLSFSFDFQEAEPIQDTAISLNNALDNLAHEPAETALPESMGALPVHKGASSSAAGANGFQAGQQVYHQRYGQGVIKRVITMDDEHIILNINFDDIGKRLLDPRLTQLEKVS